MVFFADWDEPYQATSRDCHLILQQSYYSRCVLEDFISLPAHDLLERFGSGGHKPGSGSAAALQGMLSCALVQTVILLTDGRTGYDDATLAAIRLPRVQAISAELSSFFQEDSQTWDRVIVARRARDEARKANNTSQAEQHGRAALQHQRQATELPLRMAHLCAELAEIAFLVFDVGFRSARGDSLVAAAGATAAAAGCVGIALLNLKDFRPGQWAAATLADADSVERAIAGLERELGRRRDVLRRGTPVAQEAEPRLF